MSVPNQAQLDWIARTTPTEKMKEFIDYWSTICTCANEAGGLNACGKCVYFYSFLSRRVRWDVLELVYEQRDSLERLVKINEGLTGQLAEFLNGTHAAQQALVKKVIARKQRARSGEQSGE